MNDIQSAINEIAKKTDRRTSVFEVEVQWLKNSLLSLSGRVLHESQLHDLRRALPDLKLDVTTVKVLHQESLPRLHVTTNLTGLYEKPTFSLVLSSELTYGTGLEMLAAENQWVFTRQQDGYLGWTYRPYLEAGPAPEATHIVIVPAGRVRAEPDDSCEAVTRLLGGTAVFVEGTRGEWSYVHANRAGWIPSRYLRSLGDLPKTMEQRRTTLVEDAKRMTGVPYLWGGTSGNGIDCSGFTRLLHRWLGLQIPRDADMQHAAASPVEPPFLPGDLFFFKDGEGGRRITHVGVSLGGWKMVHSSRGNNGVYVDDLQEHKSMMSTYVSAGSFIREA